MKSNIHTEPTVTISWMPNEREVIVKTLAKFAKKFRHTGIDWTNHLQNTGLTETYSRTDLVVLNGALAEWQRPAHREDEERYLVQTATELFEKTEELIEEMDETQEMLE